MQTKAPGHKILHPFLFAVYPVLALLAHNIEALDPFSALRSLLVSAAIAALLWLLLNTAIKDWPRSALVSSLTAWAFFGYGHVYNAVEGVALAGLNIGRHRFLFPVWVVAFLLLAGWFVRKRGDLSGTIKPLNAVAVVLLLYPVYQISLFSLRSASLPENNPRQQQAGLTNRLSPNPPLRDIYYIILDGYTRDDILLKNYQIDNRPFLESLENMGFYTAWCSQSNYAQTQLSLASSLNLDYVDALGENFRAGNTSRVGLGELIHHSAVRSALESLGYSTVAFETGFESTQIEDADSYLAARTDLEINDFENMLIRTTALRVLSEGVTLLNLPPDWEARDQAHRERVLFTLETLRQLPEVPGPKFVFAHIVAPHWPHVFGPNGEAVHETPDSASGYRNQVLFMNDQILPIIQEIIAESKTDPIIIIQGDHGSVIESPRRRMSILNAYLLPDGGRKLLYESISPVNTFRIVLNHYFDAQFELLDDVGYYSTYDMPYDYQVIPEERSGCQSP